MRKGWWFRRKKNAGTIPQGMTSVVLHPNPNAQYFYQEKVNWTWGSAPAHEQRSALVNAWQGNQLPGPTNFIPGVPLSHFTWNIPTSYANSLVWQQQYNKAYNIQSSTPQQQAAMLQQAIQAWQNRSDY